jgi:hypothetical protein
MLLGGVLGVASYFLFTWGWSTIFLPRRVSIELYPTLSFPFWSEGWYNYAPFYQSLLLAFPFLAVWLAAVIERSRRYGQFKTGWRLNLLLLPLLIHSGFTVLCLQHEGKCTVNEPEYNLPVNDIFTKYVTGNRLYYITHSKSANPDRLCVVNPDTFPAVSADVLADFGMEANIEKYLSSENREPKVYDTYSPYLSEDRIALLGFSNRKIFLYSYDKAGHVSLIKTFTQEYHINTYMALPENHLQLIMQETRTPTEPGNNTFYISDLNLSDGSISPATLESDLKKRPESWVVYSETRRCLFEYQLDNTTDVHMATKEGKYIEIPYRFQQAILDNTLLAGISHANIHKILLIDTTDLHNPRTISLDFPIRLKLENIVLRQWILSEKSWGYNVASLHTIYRYPVFVTLGGGYLFLWTENNRVAVWDIHDLNHIQFLGMAVTPNNRPIFDSANNTMFIHHRPTMPITRPDGALGLLFHDYGLVWLEFPALMKEKQS